MEVLKIYMRMILDGSAFSNYKNKPDHDQRRQIIESIIGSDRRLHIGLLHNSFSGRDVEKIINDIDNENVQAEVQRMFEKMKITEEEFIV